MGLITNFKEQNIKFSLTRKDKLLAVFNVIIIPLFILLVAVQQGERVDQTRGNEALPQDVPAYQLTLDQNTTLLDWTVDNFTVLTSSGNSVSFANKYPKSISNGFIGINNGGWINNTSSITGLKSINVTIGSGSLLLSYGYSSSVYASENITLPIRVTIIHFFMNQAILN